MADGSAWSGKQIGNYYIVGELASGGFGSVYQARHAIFTGRPVVAVKLLHTHLDSQREHREFIQEARLLERLRHPSILPIIDAGVHEGFPYLVTEYAPNGSLRGYLRQRKSRPLPLEDALAILTQIGEGLQFAHEQNVIHRDLKPENILFNAREEAVLADFGIAMMLDSSSIKSANTSGTPAYMAPEQFRGSVSKQSDQYGLGCIAYELLTGRKPFLERDPIALMVKHTSEEPPPPKRINSRLPSYIERAVLKALSKERIARFPDVAAFIAALHGEVGGTRRERNGIVGRIVDGRVVEAGEQEALWRSSSVAPEPEIIELARPGERTPVGRLPPVVQSPATTRNLDDDNIVTGPSDVITPVEAGPARYMGALPAASPPDLQHVGRQVSETKLKAGGTSDAGRSRPDRAGTGKGRRVVWVVALVVAALVIVSGGLSFFAPGTLGPLARFIPWAAPLATVTIAPASVDLKNTYQVTAVTGTPDPAQHQVQARTLSSPPQSQQATVNATGQGHAQATQATGTLTFFNGEFVGQTVPKGTSFTVNGVTIITDADANIPSGNPPNFGQIAVPAHAIKVGVNGNIPVGAINEFCCNTNQTIKVQNLTAFTGGQDAQTFTAVQQSDIDGGANPMKGGLTQNAQGAFNALIHENEQIAGQPQCAPRVSADHAVGDKATAVVVTVTVVCVGEVYDRAGAQALAANLLRQDASRRVGQGYALVGKLMVMVGQTTVSNAGQGTISLPVNAEGVWAYQFSDAQQQLLKRLIPGRSVEDARRLLLRQPGVSRVDIRVAGGDGTTLPTDGGQIVIMVQGVHGA